MKSQKKKKESASALQKKEGEGHRLVQQIHVRQASAAEAVKIEQALDRLLSEIVRQKQARERNKSS